MRSGKTVRLLGIAVVLLAIYLGPRLHAIDRMLNTDEVDWLGGAANVYTGVAHGDLGATYQLPHPGATTLWAGVIAYVIRVPDYPARHPGPLGSIHGVHTELRALGVDPMDMLVTARIVKLVFQAVLFLVAAWLLLRLFGRWVAATALLLVAFDPFLIGNDRFLHIDGLVAIASFAAVLAIAGAQRRRDHRWLWALAGALSAVAWLTRFTAGVLGVVAVAAILIPPLLLLVRRRSSGGEAWRTVRAPLVAYLGSSVVATFALWPALLVDPVGVLTRMWAYVSTAATVGHELPMFYNGAIVSGDPGWGYYPDAILWRITPVVVLGVATLIVGAAARRRAFLPPGVWQPVAIVVAFAVLYGVLMDAGAKKFDRYILPVFPVLDLLAALGIVGAARLVWRARWRRSRVPARPRRAVAIGAVAVILLAQVGAAWSDRAYGFDYYNPLRGGTAGAQGHMQLGWGEGLDQAAAFILAQPDGATATVRSANNQVTLGYFMPPTATVLNSGLRDDAAGLIAWADTDYYVSYLPQWERDLNPVIQQQAARFPPLDTVTIDGVDFAHVYDLRTIPPPPEMVAALPCRWVFGDRATLLTYRDQSVKAHHDDPNRRQLSLYFQAVTDLPADTPVRVRLVPRDDEQLTPITTYGTLQPAASDGLLSTVDVDFTLPTGRTTGSYRLEVSVADPVSHRLLDVRPVGGKGLSQDRAVANQCENAGVVA